MTQPHWYLLLCYSALFLLSAIIALQSIIYWRKRHNWGRAAMMLKFTLGALVFLYFVQYQYRNPENLHGASGWVLVAMMTAYAIAMVAMILAFRSGMMMNGPSESVAYDGTDRRKKIRRKSDRARLVPKVDAE